MTTAPLMSRPPQTRADRIASTPYALGDRHTITPQTVSDWFDRLPGACPFADDSHHDDNVAPPRWASFIGQGPLLDQLRVNLDAARHRGDALDPVLLAGGAGMGKTTIARLVAADLGRGLVMVKRSITSRDLSERLRHAGPAPILFVDEVHLFDRNAQHDLMQLIEDGDLDVGTRRVAHHDVSVIAATTNPEKLVGPLVDRFTMLPVTPYTAFDMQLIVAGMAYRLGFDVADVTIEFQEILGDAAAGSPRAARRLVKAARNLRDAGRPYDGLSVLAFTGVDTDGMTADHLRYLEALATSPKDAVGETALAQMLTLPPGQVRRLETLLLDRNYIVLAGRGRQITAAGHRRLT